MIDTVENVHKDPLIHKNMHIGAESFLPAYPYVWQLYYSVAYA
jgi:hypothetical protein